MATTVKTHSTVYIAGPMTGRPEFNFPAFHEAAKRLRAQGHTVVNPAELYKHTDQPWDFYIRGSLKAMLDCDTIYLLQGWRNSRGAKIEAMLAGELAFSLWFQ